MFLLLLLLLELLLLLLLPLVPDSATTNTTTTNSTITYSTINSQVLVAHWGIRLAKSAVAAWLAAAAVSFLYFRGIAFQNPFIAVCHRQTDRT